MPRSREWREWRVTGNLKRGEMVGNWRKWRSEKVEKEVVEQEVEPEKGEQEEVEQEKGEQETVDRRR